MPETWTQWYMFLFYTVGSAGGIVFLLDKLVVVWRERSRLNRELDDAPTYNPWAVDEPREQPVLVPNRIEPPISARTK